MSEDGLFVLVKCRTLAWNITVDFINSEKVKWWNVNPMGVVTTSLKLKELQLTSVDSDLVAFIDGSYSSKTSKGLNGGFGRVVRQNGNKILSLQVFQRCQMHLRQKKML